MKNITNIIKHDLKKITGSVVAIVTIMGLCIVPCLYAWFNIFSNWSPYDTAATGRIAVAVVSEDEGAEAIGLSINVGDKIIEALKGNDQIGWRLAETSEDAIEGVYAGDYYAALVIPKEFSADVMSFLSGTLENPRLVYYENEKKNAIAPKITGKAKTALQEEINKAFVETLAKYVSEAVSIAEASGYDPQEVFGSISDKMDIFQSSLDNCIAMIDAASGLSDSAQYLLEVSETLLGDAETTIDNQQDLLKITEKSIPDIESSGTEISDTVRKSAARLYKDLDSIEKVLTHISTNMDSYNEFIRKDLDAHTKLTSSLAEAAGKLNDYLSALGFTALADRMAEIQKNLTDLANMYSSFETADAETWPEQQELIREMISNVADTKAVVELVQKEMKNTNLDDKLESAAKDAKTAVADVRKLLKNMNGDMGVLGSVLGGFEDSMGSLGGDLDETRAVLQSVQGGFGLLSGLFSGLAGNDMLSEMNGILSDDQETVASYIASPIRMKTEIVYPVREFGSVMAPFYTVLAQWVGSLLAAVLIKVKIKKRRDLQNPRLVDLFFGRYGLFLLIGITQALIVSLGDLLYIGIQCTAPVRFVLAACVNGITFTMINYALVFALDNIGMAAGIIILLVQVAGSGGTYPAEVLPGIFRILNPFMPFRYAMDAMRECIAGMYGGTYYRCLLILGAFALFSVAFGLSMYRPALRLNRLISESKEKSEIML